MSDTMERNWERDCKNYRAMYLEMKERAEKLEGDVEKMRPAYSAYCLGLSFQNQAHMNQPSPLALQQMQAMQQQPLGHTFGGVFGSIL